MKHLRPAVRFLMYAGPVALLLGVSACADSVDVAPNFQILPETLHLRVGESDEVFVVDGPGSPLNDADLEYSSEDESIARISAFGRVTGISPGQTTILAQRTSSRATGTVIVNP